MTEAELEIQQLCPYMDLKDLPENKLFLTAASVLHGVIRETFYSGAVPKKAAIREMFTAVWKSTYYPELSGKEVPGNHPTFWEGPKKAAHVANKIHWLLYKYEILHPRQPYSLDINDFSIDGAYALLKTRISKQPMILMEHSHRPLNYYAPVVAEWTRILHASRTHPEWDIIPVANLPLLRGDGWLQNRVKPGVAENWLRQLLETFPTKWPANDIYPIAGGHCGDCKSRTCLRIL